MNSFTAQVILGLTGRFHLGKFSKNQILSFSNMVIKWININFRTQRSWEKPFLIIFGRFWTKSTFWKKKFLNLLKNGKKCHIFEISVVRLWPKLAGFFFTPPPTDPRVTLTHDPSGFRMSVGFLGSVSWVSFLGRFLGSVSSIYILLYIKV